MRTETMNETAQCESADTELLPSSSQFFPASSFGLPFSSAPREDQQPHQAFTGDAKQLPCPPCPGPTPSAAWLQQTQSKAVSDVRSQQDYAVLSQLRAQQAQLLQLTAAVSQATAGAGFNVFSINSSSSQKMFSMPSESQQSDVRSLDTSQTVAGRPGELSPVPEQPISSTRTAVNAAIGHGDCRRQLLKTQSQQYAQLSSTGTQLAPLWLPSVPSAADGGVLHTRSAPSSPKHDTLKFVNRSLSLQKTPKHAAGPLQQDLQNQEHQELSCSRNALHIATASPAPALLTWESGSPATDDHSKQQRQQQQLLSVDVDSSSMLASRDLSRQLSSRPSSIKGSITNQAEQLLQAEVARLHNSQRGLQERLLSSQQQLTGCQELVAEQQQQQLAARAELAAADKARTHLLEQLQHLEAKVHATESQLEFAHRQLEVRKQELRGQADATSAAQRSGEQLEAEVKALKEELLASRRELEAVNKRLAVEASEARRAVDEVASLRRDLAAMQVDNTKARQNTADVREQGRQESAEADRRAAQMNGQIADMAQQIALLKERGSAMQTANDRLHDQLASAEGDNTALRADLANLLRTHQELVHSREESKQLQLEANRHIAQLEADVSDLSQQLMLARSHNDRLNQRLSAAEAEHVALLADLDSAWPAASAAKLALQQAHIQCDVLEQQYKQQQQREWQLQSQLQQQQMVRAAAPPAVPAAETGFGVRSSGYQEPHQDLLKSSHRREYGERAVEVRSVGLTSPTSPYHRYEHWREATPTEGFSCSRPVGAAVSSSIVDVSAARLGAAPSLSSPARDASAYYAVGATAPSYAAAMNSPGIRDLPAVPSPAPGDSSRWGPVDTGAQESRPVMVAATPAMAIDRVRGVAIGSGGSVATQQQRPRAVGASRGEDIPWFAGGSRARPDLSPTPAAPQHQQQQPNSQKQQQQHEGYTAAAGYLAAEPSQKWQQYQPTALPQQQQMADANALSAAAATVAPAVTSSGNPVRLAPVMISEQQQSLQAAAGGPMLTPFGTEMTVAEIMARTKELEDMLLAYCQEKDDLNKEYSRMPLGAGKTLKDRNRKQFVEQRLEALDASISKTRMQLKKILGR